MKSKQSYRIQLVKNDREISACYGIMHQLRPHIPQAVFLRHIQLQMKEGYHMAYLLDNEKINAVAGFRILNNLAWGKFLYVDDLVTDSDHRSRGYGGILLKWLIGEAKKNNCNQLHLDSGVQRNDAHRFYLREKMEKTSYHFAIKL